MTEQVIEVVTGRKRRRRWSIEEKLRIVDETFEPGASVGWIAARHDLYPGPRFGVVTVTRSGSLPAGG